MVLTTCGLMLKGPQGWCGEPVEECGQPPASHWLLPAIFPDLPLPHKALLRTLSVPGALSIWGTSCQTSRVL